MRTKIGFIKSTIIGGLFFLVPVAVIIFMVNELVGFMRNVADSLAPVIPMETVLGGLALNLIALIVVVGLCFLAGLIAQGARARRVRAKLESILLTAIPGYSFVKGFADSMRQSDELAESFFPILVRFDDYSQLAFEIERVKDSDVVVYLPGAPNPWSGKVVYVTPDRITHAPMTVMEMVQNLGVLGRGSGEISERAKENTSRE
jgi:uncharacterized membrane protein